MENNKIEIRITKLIPVLMDICAIILIPTFFIGSIVLLLWSLYLFKAQITINYPDATLQTWLNKTIIKDIESIDIDYLDCVIITGRGGRVMKMNFIGNGKQLRKWLDGVHSSK